MNISAYWKDIGWLISGNALATAAGMLAMPFLTRLYLPDHFALLALFTQFLGFLSVVQTGRYEYLIHLPKEEREAKGLLALVGWIGLAACLIETPVAWFLRVPLSNLLRSPELGNWLVLLPISASLLCLAVALEIYSQRQNEFRHASFAEVANKGGYVGVALLGYFFLPLPAGLMLAAPAGSVAKAGWLGWPLAKKTLTRPGVLASDVAHPRHLPLLRKVASNYFGLSRSMVFSHLLQSGSVLIPSFFLMRFHGSDAMGQFALVVSTISVPTTLIASAIGKVYYQRSADLWIKGGRFDTLWHATFRKALYIGIPLYLFVAVASPWAYPLVFGANWTEAGKFGALTAISAFFSFISSPMDRGCYIVEAGWYILFWSLFRAVAVGFVALLAWYFSWSSLTFVAALAGQMSLVYLIDLFANYRFAHGLGSRWQGAGEEPS